MPIVLNSERIYQGDKPNQTVIYEQPSIKISQASLEDDILRVVGVANDERGVQSVVLFLGDDKLYFRGETELNSSVPFAVEHRVDETWKTQRSSRNKSDCVDCDSLDVYVLVKDVHGLTNTQHLRLSQTADQ